jgi:hypothetical protein
VFVQDQTTESLDVPLLFERTSTTVAVDTAIGDRTVDLTSAASASVGDILEMAEADSGNFLQSRILSISVNEVTIDQPVNRVYKAGSVAVISTDDMLVDGSVTPQVFSILPLPNQAGDMVRVLIDIRGSAAMDFSTFGSDPALTNGCVLRVKRKDGTFRNIFNWKNNGDFINRSLDHEFLVNVGNNQRAFVSRTTFGGQSKRGVVIRLDGALGEELQVVIQDDLVTGSLNSEFRMIAQGHELQGEK